MRKTLIALGLFALMAAPAAAQQVNPPTPPIDPRLAGPTVTALQSLLALREAELRALQQDSIAKLAEREKAWADYAKPLYEAAPPPKAEEAPAMGTTHTDTTAHKPE